MFRCLPDFENCFNYVFDQQSTDGIFLFHGFPSQKNRNKDLAFELFNKTKDFSLLTKLIGQLLLAKRSLD